MSRFVLISAHVDGSNRYKSGTKVADQQANALPGDKISPVLCAHPTKAMDPLDAGAVAALAAVGIVSSVGGPTGRATGAESID